MPTSQPPTHKAAGISTGVASKQTRALFKYRRLDTAPNGLTTVDIDASVSAQTRINPDIFGNFIEHLGGVIYEGLWAQALLNPNLERIHPEDKTPPAWRLSSADWIDGGYKSPLGVRLSEQSDGYLSQSIHLPTRRTHSYLLSLFARREGVENPSVVSVTIKGGRRNNGAEAVFGSTAITVVKTDWQRFEVKMELSADAPVDGSALGFELGHVKGGDVLVDQIELVPADAIDGMDPDVLAKAREWKMPLVRWPGGNFASGYNWTDGIGPHYLRPTRKNAAWDGIEPNHFGTDEFMKFCHILGVQPQLTVNAGDGDPELAADWVRYCNDPVTSVFGAKRAANGSKAPYNVKIWEIGNELYGSWQIGHATPEQNADRFVRFRDAMLAADPSINIIATGKGDEFQPDGIARDRDWNVQLLHAAIQNGGKLPNWLSLHPLVPLPGGLGGLSYEEQYDAAMAHPTFIDRTMIPAIASQITEIEGPTPKTRIAITEWGLIVGGAGWQNGPNHDTLAGALYNALALNAMLRNSDWVTLANMTAFMHGGGIKKPAGIVIVDPQYWTQKLYATSGVAIPVAATTVGPGSSTISHGFLPAVDDVPDVDIFSGLSTDKRTLIVFAVNKTLMSPRLVNLNLHGFESTSVFATRLTGEDPSARNSISSPENVHPRDLHLPPTGAEATQRPLSITLPPHSLTVFRFTGALSEPTTK